MTAPGKQLRPNRPAPLISGPAAEPRLAYRRADLHLHSSYSYDVLNLPELSPRALYDRAIARGMGFFCLTDHDTMRGYEALRAELEQDFGDRPPIPLISGVEIKVRDANIGHTIHVNVLGLERRDLGQLARRRRSLDAFLDYCQERDLFHAYNHPFWFERGESAAPSTIAEIVRRFPVIELNAGRIPQLNGRALALARRYGRQVVATSDSHTGQVGKAYTEAPGETPEEFLSSIRRGAWRAAPRHTSLREFRYEIRETIDLVFRKRNPFRPKRTFLRQMPWARRVACAVLGSEALMGTSRFKAALRCGLEMLALTPAYTFILRQRRMDGRMESPPPSHGTG